MTSAQKAEFDLLKHATEQGKFVAPLGVALNEGRLQLALERLQLRGWLNLIDISPITLAPGLYRVFLASPEAMTWVRSQQ